MRVVVAEANELEDLPVVGQSEVADLVESLQRWKIKCWLFQLQCFRWLKKNKVVEALLCFPMTKIKKKTNFG